MDILMNYDDDDDDDDDEDPKMAIDEEKSSLSGRLEQKRKAGSINGEVIRSDESTASDGSVFATTKEMLTNSCQNIGTYKSNSSFERENYSTRDFVSTELAGERRNYYSSYRPHSSFTIMVRFLD
mmetsp:Transcript_5606/g.10890  ORF Transcript_5606/g.10890 Transcript_5606/m.10890 type:complete len:125 (+) Transcript_5606:95-469(+)|eukprot:scaffold8605_cov178-Amphora_coffeaeformis.AAC.3